MSPWNRTLKERSHLRDSDLTLGVALGIDVILEDEVVLVVSYPQSDCKVTWFKHWVKLKRCLLTLLLIWRILRTYRLRKIPIEGFHDLRFDTSLVTGRGSTILCWAAVLIHLCSATLIRCRSTTSFLLLCEVVSNLLFEMSLTWTLCDIMLGLVSVYVLSSCYSIFCFWYISWSRLILWLPIG